MNPRPYWPRTTDFGPGVCSERSTFPFSFPTDPTVNSMEGAIAVGTGNGSRRVWKMARLPPALPPHSVQLLQRRRDSGLAALGRDVRGHVAPARGEPLPGLLVERVARVLLHRLLHPLPERGVGLLGARDGEDGEMLRQEPPELERV